MRARSVRTGPVCDLNRGVSIARLHDGEDERRQGPNEGWRWPHGPRLPLHVRLHARALRCGPTRREIAGQLAPLKQCRDLTCIALGQGGVTRHFEDTCMFNISVHVQVI